MRYLLIIFFLGSISVYGQGEANNWYFGVRAGINFGTTPPTALTDGVLSTLEGCTTISDPTGNLLFYTDGSIIYNRNHAVMVNGTGLNGDESSTSSALIVPQPNTPNMYIVFTVDEPHHDNADNDPNTLDGDGVNDGLQYSIVDMTLDGGNGAVVTGQKNLPLATYNPDDQLESLYKCSEKITAVKSDDCDAFWVITHFIDTYYAFKIDESGVNTTAVTSKVGVTVPVSGYRRNALGYLKASTKGDKLAVAHLGLTTQTGGNGPGKVLLYDFDNTSGSVSNELELYNGDSPYGIEFSQNGERLYSTIGIGDAGNGNGTLIQFDLSLPTDQVAGSGTRIRNEDGQGMSAFSAGALQLGPDGKIYRALFNFGNGFGDYLGVIDNPEAPAANVIYKDRGILVNTDGTRASRIGLPPFIQSIFAQTIDIVGAGNTNAVNIKFCEGDTFRLEYENTSRSTYTWFIDDVQIANTTNFLDITETGNYRLEVDLNDGSCPLIGVANATFFEVPKIEGTPEDQTICSSNNDGIVDLDLAVYDTVILGSQDPNQFQVRYYRSLLDAEAGTNVLPQDFTTENNPQTLVARIENIENPECYSTTSFDIQIFKAAEAFPVDPIIACDNEDDGDNANGRIQFDLTSLNTSIYNDQSPSEFSISYHTSALGAENNIDLIADPTNAVLSNTITAVYARIENTANTKCFDTLEIPVTIYLLPEANPSTLVQCDDINSPEGITIFNLNEATAQITGNAANRSLRFFEDLVSANLGSSEITNPSSYQNTQANQQLFVNVTDDDTSCSRMTTLNLEVSTTSASNATLMVCDDDGKEDGLAEFDLTQARNQILLGISSPNLVVTYYETIDQALSELNPITTFTNTIPGTQGQEIIYARIENNPNKCFGINQIQLFVNPLPNTPESETYFLCQNESVSIDSGIQELGNNPNNYTYLWSTGETSEAITVTQAGSYQVLVTDRNTSCSRDRSLEVILSGPAVIENILIDDTNTSNSVRILADGPGEYEYAIAYNDSNILQYQDNPLFRDVPPGFHTVYVRDMNGCLPVITEKISVVGFPQFFSPNGDGDNETWSVVGISNEVLGNSIVHIYNRNGKLLKQLRPDGNGWDGTFNGRLMPSSQYWYRVQLEDGRIRTGSFSLIR